MKPIKTLSALACVALVGLLPAANCNPPDGPQMCVLAGDMTNVPSLTTCPANAGTLAIHDGQVFTVMHVLPEGVSAPGTVHVHVETPCSAQDADLTYAGQVALGAFVAGPGASCSLVVTASIENSDLRQSAGGGAASCAQTACTVDAGAGDADMADAVANDAASDTGVSDVGAQ